MITAKDGHNLVKPYDLTKKVEPVTSEIIAKPNKTYANMVGFIIKTQNIPIGWYVSRI